MNNIVNFPRQERIASNAYIAQSYEDVLRTKIRAAKHRCEGYQMTEMWHEADMEIARYQAFEEALTVYSMWGI